MRELIEALNPVHLDLAGGVAGAFFENPFLETDPNGLALRFGRKSEIQAVIEDLCRVGVLTQDAQGVRLSATGTTYGDLLEWVMGLRGEDETLRSQVVAHETLARLREKLAVRQEEVSFILDAVPVGVILLDRLGQVLKANAAAQNLKVSWEDIRDGLGVPLDALHAQTYEAELETSPPLAITTRPFQVAGSETGLVVLIQDITVKRQMAAQAEKLREDFFSMIRHELRKPLLTIERSLAQMGPSKDELPLALARSATEHLGAMIDDMLFLARLERDPLAVSVGSGVSLKFLLAGCDLAFRQKAAQARISFGVDLPESDLLFMADERRIQQVLGNLLDNAFKFTPDGGEVTLQGIRRGDDLHFLVTDSGPGIPSEEREQVFRKFYQVRTDAGRQPGLGLGLAICSEVIRAHGGRIEIFDAEPVGTTVRVSVPINRSEPI